MTSSIEHISQQVFKILKGFGHDIVLFDEDGQKTVDPDEARRFYIKNLKAMINFDADTTNNDLTINLSKGTEIDNIKSMLNSLRKLSSRYILNYTVKTFGKTIGPKDFSFMAKKKVDENKTVKESRKLRQLPDIPQDGDQLLLKGQEAFDKMSMLKRKGWKVTNQGTAPDGTKYMVFHYSMKNPPSKYEAAESTVNEGFSGWHGSAKKSINELGDARLVVKHRRTVDEEKRGARTRQIESIFIENSEGERFKFPSKNITAAKAMVRHVKEGGTPFDEFGQYIYETMEELNQLKTFQRKNRRNDFFEDAQIGEEIGGRINELRSNLKQISGVKGYAYHFENFTRENADVDKEKLDELKDSVTIQYFDESISDSLPYVAKVIENMRGRQAKENHIVELAQYVMNNKDDITMSREIDNDDPENPSTRNFKDPATAVSAWVNYLAPMVKDDKLSNLMMQASDSVFEVSTKHINMAAAAINVIRKNAKIDEGAEEINEQKPLYDEEISSINETFSKYDIKHIFRG